jgi:MFS family permease
MSEGAVGRPDSARREAGSIQGFVLILVNTMTILAMASLVSSLPKMFAHFKDLPGKEVLVPMILTVPTLCIGLFAGLAGAASDRWGRRPMLIGALAMFAIVGLMPMLFDNIWLILLSRLGVGLAEAVIPACGNALMGDYFQGERRQRWLGYQAMGGPALGSIVLLAGGALGTISWRLPFIIYTIGGGLALIAVLLTIWEPARPTRAEIAADPLPPFAWGRAAKVGAVTMATALLFFLQNVQHGRIFAGLGVDSPARISVLVMAASIGTIIGGYAFKRAPFRRIEQLLAGVYFFFAISYIGLYLSPNYVIGTAFDFIGQFAGGFSFPVLIWWTLSQFDVRNRGRGAGVWSSCFYVSSFLSPLLMSFIGNWTPNFLASVGVVGFICAIVAAFLIAASVRNMIRSPTPAVAAPGP